MFELGKTEVLRAGFWATAAAAGALSLSACGQTTPPSPKEVQSNIQYFELDHVKTPKGDPVRCVMYADGSHTTNDSHSWFSIDCDYAGVAQFPPEAFPTTPSQTPTPTTTETLPTPSR